MFSQDETLSSRKTSVILIVIESSSTQVIHCFNQIISIQQEHTVVIVLEINKLRSREDQLTPMGFLYQVQYPLQVKYYQSNVSSKHYNKHF